ncbi:MAG TPA: hypothetical protein VKK81_05930 [Candidatus Binatia bacterium]|nr:hypothetical protein [Candidatus Binatia bacterium]
MRSAYPLTTHQWDDGNRPSASTNRSGLCHIDARTGMAKGALAVTQGTRARAVTWIGALPALREQT